MVFELNPLSSLLLLVPFLLGSVPFGLWMARLFHVKGLREKGSGNIGATNVSRVVGFWPAGFLTFVLDTLKGALPPLVMALPGFKEWWEGLPAAFELPLSSPATSPTWIWLSGLCAVLGHCYSPWLRFKGGKGVATAFGMILVVSPISALVALMGFGAAFYAKRTASIASITGMILAAATHVTLYPVEPHLWVGALVIAVVLVRHESNLDALLAGQEKSFV